MKNVLIVDDEVIARNSLASVLRADGYFVGTAAGGPQALKWLDENDTCDLVITDLKMAGMTGIELLEKIKSKYPYIEVIVITTFGSLESAVEAIKKGAFDYLSKPAEPEKILVTVQNALEKKSLTAELGFIKRELRKKFSLDNFLGKSVAVKNIKEKIRKIAATDSTVLIIGETGTGKQLVAQAILNLSKRAEKPWIDFNCVALPKEILESELFGHVKGAFTGAFENKKGFFEEADGGTIFFDEIGATTITFQNKLLKAIEEKFIRRVGSTKALDIDVRIIAASNRNLDELIVEGGFRQDLYFRLNVASIFIPPLRERKKDIPLLCDYFLRKYSSRIGKNIEKITPSALELLKKYNWPGNVRELEHAIERAIIFGEADELTAADFHYLSEPAEKNSILERAYKYEVTLEALEKEYIQLILNKNDGNKSKSAKKLGINRNTLAEKVKKYQIDI